MTAYTVVEYQYGSGQTIEAAIKLVNHQSINKTMLTKLLKDYKIINGDGVPRMGQTVYIPVFSGFIGANSKFATTTVEV